MRFISALLFLFMAIAFSAYSQPPLVQTNQYNLNVTSELNLSASAAALNGTVNIPMSGLVHGIPVGLSIEPVGFSVSVDNVTCPMDNLSFIALRGASMGHLTSLPSPGAGGFTCDRAWYAHFSNETSWRCDLDGDYCVEYENYTAVSYDIDIIFSFGNVSVSVPYDSQLVPVPHSILEAMRSGSGGNLTVAFNGTATFLYQINDRMMSGGKCIDNYESENTTIPYSLNRSFAVGGSGSFFFLRSPVLREQWASNNQFDVIVLSQSPLYHADILLNGQAVENITLRSFDVQEDSDGLQGIISIPNPSPGAWTENTTLGLTQPALDAKNRSFSYIYQFNYSYPGLGNNTLYLGVDDSCLVHSAYSNVLLSRMLSYNGSTAENGQPFDAAVARPSAPFSTGALGIITFGFGVAAIIVIVAFTNFWLLR